jgi:hypothetical protein
LLVCDWMIFTVFTARFCMTLIAISLANPSGVSAGT